MKRVLITGPTSGIGQATTQLLIQKGYSVIGISKTASKADFKSNRYLGIDFDLSNLKELPDFLKKLHQNEPEIDAVIFNAAAGHFGHLEQFSYEQIQHSIQLNLTSHIFLAKSIVPQMKKNKKGTLIFIGSEAALHGASQGTLYCASKFAIRGFTQALRKECAKEGISVSLINPGAVKTAFFDSLHFEPKDQTTCYCTADEVANVILQQIESRNGLVFEEINLAPLNKQIIMKNKMALK